MYWNKETIEDIIKNAIREDLWLGDITTDNLITPDKMADAYIVLKEEGVVAGLQVARMVFEQLNPQLQFKELVGDGELLSEGEKIVKIKGSTRDILKGERLALNFLQRLSGIATRTREYTEIVKDYPVRIVDTRKTTPNLRILEKYAVTVGGGYNHRMNLSDAVMIKDNHITAAGGIKETIKKVRENVPHTAKIEVEVEDLTGVEEALQAGADIIMLDNMNLEMMSRAVKMIDGRAIVEASGGITEESLKNVAATGVDVISVGALTHHIKSLDISLYLESSAS